MATRSRVLFENVTPIIDSREYTTKRVVNDLLQVETDLIADGHNLLNCCLKIRKNGKKNWAIVSLKGINQILNNY